MLDTQIFERILPRVTDLFLTFLLALLGGVIGSLVHKWGIERKIRQFEFDLYSLVERVNTEVKRRASQAGKRAQEFDAQVLEAAKTAQPVNQSPLWWVPKVPAGKTG